MALDMFTFGGGSDVPDPNVGDNAFNDGIGYVDNAVPVVSDEQEMGSASILQKLGSIGQTATDLGTAVGTVQRGIAQAKGNFNAAKGAAASGNSLQTWWLYASTTDKLVVGLAAITLIVMLTHGE